jgi:hypothetical protein
MQEALTLFDSICNSRWFVKTSIVRTFYLVVYYILIRCTDFVLEQNRPVRREIATFTAW